jgi:hypothetical protein
MSDIESDNEKGYLIRAIQDAYCVLNAVECTRANENGVRTPEYVDYFRIVGELFSKYDKRELICYEAEPMLWDAFISMFGKTSCPYSVDEVNKKIAETLNK